MTDDSLNLPSRVSMDDSSINLNDDLVVPSENSSNSVLSSTSNVNTRTPTTIITNNNNNNHIHRGHRRTGSAISTNYRTSIDNESYILSGTFFNFANLEDQKDDIYSPLGPNSIYALTIGSDIARAKRHRAPKTNVTLNGGATTIYHVNTPTTKDIPQIQLVKLKNKVSSKELDEKYVKNIASEYKKFESSYNPLTEDILLKLAQNERKSSITSSTSSLPSPSPSSPTTIDNLKGLSTQLDAIPQVFQELDFRLDDPRVFKQVLKGTTLMFDENDPNLSITNNTELQEKLSDYLDIVEMNLVDEIAKSSDSFFSTFGDIENIQKKSTECVTNYHTLMNKIDQLEKNQSRKGLDILHKMIERKNVETLEQSLLQIQYITSLFQLANKSFTHGDYSKGLNQISAVENLLKGVDHEDITDEETQKIYPKLNLIDLSYLPAFIHLQNDLATLKRECSKGYIDGFVELLVEDLRLHFNNVPVKDTLNRIYVNKDKTKKYNSNPINTTYLNFDETTKATLREFVSNLAKAGSLSQAYSNYQSKFITEIKDIIKQNLPLQKLTDMSNTSSRASPIPNAEPVPPKQSNALSSNIKTLTPKEFENMLSKTYAQLSECLRRLTVHQKLLLDIALTSIPPTSDIDIMSLDITNAIHKAIELTQIRLMKVINVRLEQTGDLPIPFYFRLYSITSAYLQECEMINPAFAFNGAGNVLSEWFNNHVNYFVHRVHVNSVKSMINECMKENWKVTDKSDLFAPAQTIINEFIGYGEYITLNGSSGFSGDTWLKDFDFYESDDQEKDTTEDKNGGEALSLSGSGSGSGSVSTQKLTIGEQEFLVPSLVLKALPHIKDYLVISKAFPNYTSTIENNLLTYFKDMNSKASQAVLGAGATKTAGLKHITVTNICVCYLFLEVVMKIMDILTVSEVDFDDVMGSYKEHQNQLVLKIGMIVRDRGASETVGKILHRVLGDERAERIMSELGIGTPQPVSQE